MIHELASVAPETFIGERVRIGPYTVIGEDGFGFETLNGRHARRPHPFAVVLGDDVEIGSLTAIDRGRHRDTVIGRGTKIDNHVHIAHNAVIGEDCLIIAHSMIAGSVTIGNRVTISPGAQVCDHVTIGDDAHIGLGAVVIRDVPAGETWVGNPARKLR